MNSRSASRRPHRGRAYMPEPIAPARVGGPLPQGRGAAGARAPSPRPAMAADLGDHSDAAAVVDPQREGGCCARAPRSRARRSTSSDRRAVTCRRWRCRPRGRHGGACDLPPARAAAHRRASGRTGSRRRSSSRTRSGASAQRIRPACGGAPRPAASVSARCRSTCRPGRARPQARPAPSSSPTAPAASARRAPRARRCAAATSAVYRPAAPAPTTATSAASMRAGGSRGGTVSAAGGAHRPDHRMTRGLLPTPPLLARARHGRASRAPGPDPRDRAGARPGADWLGLEPQLAPRGRPGGRRGGASGARTWTESLR